MTAKLDEKLEPIFQDVLHRNPGEYTSVFTGKGLDWGGSRARTEATGYGTVFLIPGAAPGCSGRRYPAGLCLLHE